MPAAPQFTKLTQAAWELYPTSYWYCTKDETVPYGFQQHMVHHVEELGSAEIKIEQLETGHCPFISKPEAVFKLIEKTLAEDAQ
jgi:hypothetical protein